ncbi:hypothetical protein NP233_g8217 [Leucocoprinus birnbaumii]|uniref:Uncharacterized protein n=1 Tax=Leucocoprinus birnbaumii TaxID=56174 RepID=A0AAD5VMR2_9AGAR|nr:hypothetical protein NP233_g8217 [Leucocoprinus birnbaumii]
MIHLPNSVNNCREVSISLKAALLSSHQQTFDCALPTCIATLFPPGPDFVSGKKAAMVLSAPFDMPPATQGRRRKDQKILDLWYHELTKAKQTDQWLKQYEPIMPDERQIAHTGPFLEDNVSSGIYPYNAYRHPFSYMKRHWKNDPPMLATCLQRFSILTIMSAGLDAHQILNERDRYIGARTHLRIHELEAMPSTINVDVKESSLVHPFPTAHDELRPAIKLESLRLLDKQRALWVMVAERLNHASMHPLNCLEFRRTREPSNCDACNTKHSERQQRVERNLEQLTIMCTHGREVIMLLEVVLSKECLKALQAGGEKVYMKLTRTAKDTRITHISHIKPTHISTLLLRLISSIKVKTHCMRVLRALSRVTSQRQKQPLVLKPQTRMDRPFNVEEVDGVIE